MLHDTPCKRETVLWMNQVHVEFSLAGQGIKVSMHTIHVFLGLIPTSWETTVISRALDTFAFREISYLTASPSFQRQTSPQGKQ